MTGLNHATTGIVIALTVRRPEFAIPLAFLSHFVLDSIPHSAVNIHNRKVFTTYLILEAIGMIAVTTVAMILFPQSWFLIGTCAVLAFLPDMFWPFYYNGSLKNVIGFKQFYAFHHRIQWSETYRGWLVEVLYFFVLITFLATYHASII